MPCSTGCARRRPNFSAATFAFSASKSERSTCSPARNVVSPGSINLDLLQHLANDHLDVLVVNRHTLEAIDLLDLVDEVFASSSTPSTRRISCGTAIAVDQEIAALDEIAFLHRDMLALRNQILDPLRAFLVRHDQHAALGLVVLAELDATVDFAMTANPSACVPRKFRDARQTAGDVAGLRCLTRDTREHIARMHLRTVLDRENGVGRQRQRASRPLEKSACSPSRRGAGSRLRSPPFGLLLPIDYHLGRDTGRFIDDLAHRHTLDEVHVVGDTVALGDDRQGEGPIRPDAGLWSPSTPSSARILCTIRQTVARLLAPRLVDQNELGVSCIIDGAHLRMLMTTLRS